MTLSLCFVHVHGIFHLIYKFEDNYSQYNCKRQSFRLSAELLTCTSHWAPVTSCWQLGIYFVWVIQLHSLSLISLNSTLNECDNSLQIPLIWDREYNYIFNIMSNSEYNYIFNIMTNREYNYIFLHFEIIELFVLILER